MTEPSPSPAAATPDPTRHVPVLDRIRGLAILLVMPSHFWNIAFGLGGLPTDNALDRFLNHLFGSGWMGVDLFFVLSGFLITGILLDARGAPNYFRNFYARRFLRIFPLYYGFLILLLFVAPLVPVVDRVGAVDNMRANQWWYWTYAMNLGTAFKDLDFTGTLVNSHFWSLAVEEQFYLIWPATVLLIAPRRLATLCAASVVVCLALRIYLGSDAASGFTAANAAHVFTPARMDTFALGALLAIAARSGDMLPRLAKYAPAVAVASFVVVVTLFVVNGGLSILDTNVQTIGFTAIALMFTALLTITVMAQPGSVPQRIFASRPLTWLGRYAYGLYVVHVLVAFMLANRIFEVAWMRDIFLREAAGFKAPANVLTVTTGIAISCLIAWASWHLYESQFLKLKRFVPYGRGRAPAVAVSPPPAISEQPTMSVP